eukprot:4680607-Pyramimonas_sp.AAC.1
MDDKENVPTYANILVDMRTARLKSLLQKPAAGGDCNEKNDGSPAMAQGPNGTVLAMADLSSKLHRRTARLPLRSL